MGYRVPQGADVVVHAAREVVHDLHDSKTLIKLDKSNAFNSLHRNKMLDSSARPFPNCFPWLWPPTLPTQCFSLGTKPVKKVSSRVFSWITALSGWPG